MAITAQADRFGSPWTDKITADQSGLRSLRPASSDWAARWSRPSADLAPQAWWAEVSPANVRAASGEQALECLTAEAFDVVVSGLSLGTGAAQCARRAGCAAAGAGAAVSASWGWSPPTT
jgi:hypothetical protein